MDEGYTHVIGEALKLVRPDRKDEEKLKAVAKRTLEIANEELQRYDARAILAGSITRDTWLPDKKEFDIFLMFPKGVIEEELEEIGLDIGRSIIGRMRGTYIVEYAQHPYVRGKIEDVEVDIVPCYEVSSTKEMKSAVDRTPFHVKYITENLSADLSDEVRLLKKFCKANGVYGADAKTQGVSGYACEILVINYGEFMDVLRGIEKWAPGEVVDTEEFYGKGDHRNLRSKFKGEPLILIDPTDRNRNVASALSAENFFRLKKMTKRFLENPSRELFLEKKVRPITAEELEEHVTGRGTEMLVIRFEPPKVVPDILWPQLRKFADRVQSILEETKYEFKVMRKDVYANGNGLAAVLLEMEFPKLPKAQKRVGPSVFDHDDAKRFVERYVSRDSLVNGPFVEEGNWVVEVERRFLTARDKLADSLKKDEAILTEKGIPNYIAAQLVKGFRIFTDVPAIAKILAEDEGFGVFLRKYFEKESLV